MLRSHRPSVVAFDLAIALAPSEAPAASTGIALSTRERILRSRTASSLPISSAGRPVRTARMPSSLASTAIRPRFRQTPQIAVESARIRKHMISSLWSPKTAMHSGSCFVA